MSRDFSNLLEVTSRRSLVEPLSNGGLSRLPPPGAPERPPSSLLAAGPALLPPSPPTRARDEVVQPLMAFPMEVVNPFCLLTVILPSPLVTRKAGFCAPPLD